MYTRSPTESAPEMLLNQEHTAGHHKRSDLMFYKKPAFFVIGKPVILVL